MEQAKQQKTVSLDRGLFLIRYATAEDDIQPPMVRISPDPPGNRDISFFLHPDHEEGVLWQPDTCLVVRALAPGKLAVQVVPAQVGGSVAATVKIEPLSQGVAEPTWLEPKTLERGAARDHGEFRVLAHVSRTGDVAVGANEWIAGPSAPLPIEGISLDWQDKPEGLNIRYAVKTAKPHPVSGRAVELGAFAGTRGSAMPIVAVMLQVDGRAAANFQFNVEAIFLGAPATRKIGKRVVVSGPTGRETLVGLRLSLDQVGQAEQPTNKPQPTQTNKPQPI